MVGNINEAILKELICEITETPELFRSQIKVIPFLPHEELPSIYASAAVFVFFSQMETFGLPLVEAMASGLPVVASDIPIYREKILQGAGVLVSPDAPDVLAAILLKVLADKEYKEILKKNLV